MVDVKDLKVVEMRVSNKSFLFCSYCVIVDSGLNSPVCSVKRNKTLEKFSRDSVHSGVQQLWHVLTFQDDGDGVGSESLSSGTQCLVLGCNTDQPKHISTQQQHADKTTKAVVRVLLQDLTATAGWWQSDLSPLYNWCGNLNCKPPLCSVCCFFFFSCSSHISPLTSHSSRQNPVDWTWLQLLRVTKQKVFLLIMKASISFCSTGESLPAVLRRMCLQFGVPCRKPSLFQQPHRVQGGAVPPVHSIASGTYISISAIPIAQLMWSDFD